MEESTKHLPNVRVDRASKGLVVKLAREVGADVLVKGLRALTDFEYEFQMAQLNRKLDPDLETMYLMASPEYSLPQLERGQRDSEVSAAA